MYVSDRDLILFYLDSSPSSIQNLLNGSRRSLETRASPSSIQVGSPYRETTPDFNRSINSRSSSADPLLLITPSSNQNGYSPVTSSDRTETFRQRRNTNELLLYGQELVCTDTYIARMLDELTVNKGDWIYADMKHKDGRGWIWAYSPSNKTQGYVPRSCVRPPATTPLWWPYASASGWEGIAIVTFFHQFFVKIWKNERGW